MIIRSLVGTVSISKLLSSCIDASRRGCEIVRDYRAKNEVAGSLKEEGEVKSVVTQADIDAQATIVGGLRSLWGVNLKIIGEEDDECVPATDTSASLRTDILDHLCSSGHEEHELNDEIPIEEVTVFVDPLDGTREFVEGRLENVACLIGVARNQRALGGVIGLPFPDGETEGEVVIHYALLDDDGEERSTGTWPSSAKDVDATPPSKECVTLLTGDSNNAVLLNAASCAMSIAKSHSSDMDEPDHLIMGGTAAKLREVATKKNSVAILHFKTCLWDTCGPEALLHAKGGKITDLFGSPLVHSPTKKGGNVLGVVASSGESLMNRIHNELCAKMRADHTSVKKIFSKWMGSTFSGAQAVDVARDLDGAPLDISWIEEHVGRGGKGSSLKGYSVPESEAVRGMMSNGCRLLLDWDDQNADLPSSVFYKRVVMSDLDHARSKLKHAPHKLQRDVRSYQVETGFLTSKACQSGLRDDAGVHVTRVFGADLCPRDGSSPSEQIESRFSVLLEDFSEKEGWTQQWLLDERAAKATLKAFAKMHAFFWSGSKFWTQGDGKTSQELEEAVWPNGGYMQPALQGFSQLEKVNKGWLERLPSFEDSLGDVAELKGVDLKTLGERMERVAKVVGDRAHPFFESGSNPDLRPYRTLIHGDPKQANIFLRESSADGNDLEVGLIDFQWTGFGLASTDVAHFIAAALQPICVSSDGSKESALLDYYYFCLSSELVKNGVASSEKNVQENVFPRHVFQEQYEIALLDVCRMVFAYAWARWKPESEPTSSSFNRNAYNKSLPNAVWLIARCSELLTKREHDFSFD